MLNSKQLTKTAFDEAIANYDDDSGSLRTKGRKKRQNRERKEKREEINEPLESIEPNEQMEQEPVPESSGENNDKERRENMRKAEMEQLRIREQFDSEFSSFIQENFAMNDSLVPGSKKAGAKFSKIMRVDKKAEQDGKKSQNNAMDNPKVVLISRSKNKMAIGKTIEIGNHNRLNEVIKRSKEEQKKVRVFAFSWGKCPILNGKRLNFKFE